ncbi:cache domain-containing protein [Thiosocius teredinicola]|uniref:cache domain-containing protein n=1 Tax=Thiosocius teredinicola TaxID=1973002 RepID=UPI0013DE798F
MPGASGGNKNKEGESALMATAAHELTAFEEARALARRRRLRLWFPIGVVVVMLVALVGIAIFDYRTMRADTLALSKGVIVNLQSRIETEVVAYIEPIGDTIRLSRDLLSDKTLSDVRRDLVEPLGIGVLNNMPQLTSLIIGVPNGEFFMVRRYQDDKQQQRGLEVKTISKASEADGKPVVRLVRRDAAGKVISDQVVEWDGYDPRQRPWYQGVSHEEADRLFWTDVYPFFTDRAAGITGSLPFINEAGELAAVIGADVKLESLSRFLSDLKIGTTGFAFIVDKTDRVIAHPSAELVKETEAGEVRLTRVADLADPIARRAYDRFRVEGHGRRDFELNDRRYISSVSSLKHLIDRDWSVIVVVPEDDFIGFVVENVGKTLAMGLSVMLLAAFLAALLIRQGLRTDREAIRILEREAQLDAQSEAFGSTAVQSAIFDSGDENSLAPVTEAVARSSRVRRASVWQFDSAHDELRCLDCFDQEAEGHTHGNALRRPDHQALFDAIEQGVTLRELDTSNAAATTSVYSRYLDPMGCRALLSAPVKVRGEVIGALWLEDTGRRERWSDQVAQFALAMANLLAIRQATSGATVSDSQRDMASPVEKRQGGALPAAAKARRDEAVDIETSLGAQRAAAFTARLAQLAGEQRAASAEVIDELAVLSLHFTDAVVLAEPFGKSSDESVVTYLIRELERAAADHDLAYMKFLSDQVMAAADPNDDPRTGAAKLADFALQVQTVCERLFTEQQSPLAFCIGLDLGPVIGSVVGREQRAFNLWGEAAQMATDMALTGLPGSIQATETVYRALSDDYLFQLRGRHYLENIGEFSTYLMSGRL